MSLPFLHKINLGDWSQDGHNIFHVFYYRSNYDVEPLLAAYNRAKAAIGVDLEKVANQYEKGYITLTNFERFLNAGFKPTWLDEKMKFVKEFGDDTVDLDDDEFLDLFIFMLKSEIPDLVFEPANDGARLLVGGWDGNTRRPSFGYGLYQ